MQVMDIVKIANSQLREKDLQASQEMESFFIHFLLKEMRKTVPKSGLFGKSQVEEMYTDMLDQQIANNISVAGGFGLANFINKGFVDNNKAIEAYEEVQKLTKG